jgi:hypothetical protein
MILISNLQFFQGDHSYRFEDAKQINAQDITTANYIDVPNQSELEET